VIEAVTKHPVEFMNYISTLEKTLNNEAKRKSIKHHDQVA